MINPLKIFLLFYSIVGFSSPAQADVSQSEIDTFVALAKVRLCQTNLQGPLLKYDIMMRAWFVDPSNPNNLGNSFEQLRSDHAGVLDAIVEFGNRSNGKPVELEQLQKSLESLDKRVNSLTSQLLDQAVRDAGYLQKLVKIERDLSNLRDELMQARNGCEAHAAGAELIILTDELSLEIEEWARVIGRMKSYISQAAAKRKFVKEELYSSMRKTLLSRYAEVAGEKLDKVEAQLQASLAIPRLMSEIVTYTTAVSLQGLASGMVSRFMQYNQAIPHLKRQLRDIDRFAERIDNLKVGKPSKDILRSQYAGLKVMLEKTLERVQAEGWQGMIKNQEVESQKYLDRAVELGAKCEKAARKHLDFAISGADTRAMMTKDSLYLAVDRECRRLR